MEDAVIDIVCHIALAVAPAAPAGTDGDAAGTGNADGDDAGYILTIHQSIPISGIASMSLSIQVLQNTSDISGMLEQMEKTKGVHHVKILGRE